MLDYYESQPFPLYYTINREYGDSVVMKQVEIWGITIDDDVINSRSLDCGRPFADYYKTHDRLG